MKKLIIVPFVILTLSACSPSSPKKRKSSSELLTSQRTTTSIISSGEISKISENTSVTEISTSSTSKNTSLSSSVINTSTVKPSSNSSSSSDDPYFDNKEKLSCGYYTTDVPTSTPFNLVTSYDTNDWVSFNTKESLPNNFIYIYKNAYSGGPKYHTTSPNFYSDDYGGIKVTNNGIGFQTPRFQHTGEKIEIRIGIGSVNNATDKPAKDKPTAYLYCYDLNGKHLSNLDYTISTGTITKSSEGGEIKFYITGDYTSDVSYIEFRLNEKPYKGDQCYNFGIINVQLKSWPQA